MKKKIFVLKNSIFKDYRGYYWTTWKKNNFKSIVFNHDKFSISKKNVLRGFHCDFKSWKLVTCVFGKIILAVVNVDKRDKTPHIRTLEISAKYLKKNLKNILNDIGLATFVFEK